MKVIENMEQVRKIVSLGLESRQKAGIKVRQPLGQLKVKNLKLSDEYLDLIKDEVNIKEVIEDVSIETEVELDIEITPGLKEEGDYRELVRGIQEMRKKAGLTPSDAIALSIEADDIGKNLIQKFEMDLKKVVLASKIEFSANDGQEIKVDELIFKIKFI
jgi:isoleucyl-tRNA synthetase